MSTGIQTYCTYWQPAGEGAELDQIDLKGPGTYENGRGTAVDIDFVHGL